MSKAPVSRRTGSTLVELLVAMPLALIVAAAAALLLVRVGRTARAQGSVLADTRELRHARLVLAADLEPLGASELRTVSDTLLEFRGLQGVLTLCDVPDATSIVAVVPPRSSDLWVAAVRGGDEVTVWRQSGPTDTPQRVTRVIRDAPAAFDAAPCGADSTAASGRRWRFLLADSVPSLMTGTPVTVHRQVRYRHYRSGSSWWLGRQTRDGSLWESIQPVAGPLRPAGAGVRIAARDGAGAMVPVSSGVPDSARARAMLLQIALTMSRRVREVGAPLADSVSLMVPLRGQTGGRR